MLFNEPSKLFDKTKQTRWSCFVFILTHSLPIEYHVKHYLAKQSFEMKWHNFQDGYPIFHGLQLRTIFLQRALKFKVLSRTLYKRAVLFQSWNYKECIVIFVDFIYVKTPAKHSQTLHKVLQAWVICRSLHIDTGKIDKTKIHSYTVTVENLKIWSSRY